MESTIQAMSKSGSDIASQPPASLIKALEKLLRPVIRVLLHYQITYPQLIGLLKSIYVDIAEKEMQIGNKRQSDSRIHLLTGVHRKDVKRLRAEPTQPASVPPTVSAGARLIAHWVGNPDYVDDRGKPLPLPLRSEQEQTPSFENLVALVLKQDIRPRVILDEWLRLGVARMEDEQLVLNTGAFTPDKGFDEKAFFFGKNLQDHANASASNLMGLKPSYFDRSVYYDQLSNESVSELGQLAQQLGMEALTAMNQAALEKQSRDSSSSNKNSDNNYRINFGVFHFDNATRKPRSDGDES